MPTVKWDRFWCKVLFKEFIKHFRKMTDEQIAADIRQSMDDLEDLVNDSDSFGSKMVRWSMERANEPGAIARRANGKKGGRPRKPAEKIETPSTEEVYAFAEEHGLDEFDARDWFEMTYTDRDGMDVNGKPIVNWKGALKKFCESRERKRYPNG